MQVSYFETARYQVPPTMPAEWPVPPAAYDPDAGAHHRGHGADPQGVDRAAALRLAGPSLPISHCVGLAAAVAAALAADLFARHQPRIVRIRGAPPSRPRGLLCTLRGRRQVDAVLSRGVLALRLGADAGTDALPGEHSPRGDRRGGPGAIGEAAQGAGTLPDAVGGS